MLLSIAIVVIYGRLLLISLDQELLNSRLGVIVVFT